MNESWRVMAGRHAGLPLPTRHRCISMPIDEYNDCQQWISIQCDINVYRWVSTNTTIAGDVGANPRVRPPRMSMRINEHHDRLVARPECQCASTNIIIADNVCQCASSNAA